MWPTKLIYSFLLPPDKNIDILNNTITNTNLIQIDEARDRMRKIVKLVLMNSELSTTFYNGNAHIFMR